MSGTLIPFFSFLFFAGTLGWIQEEGSDGTHHMELNFDSHGCFSILQPFVQTQETTVALKRLNRK